MGLLDSWFDYERRRSKALATGRVVPDPSRCVQCGICSFNCPLGIDVRAHAWRGEPVNDGHCITCGECVARCPRGVLRFEQIPVSLEHILNQTHP
ncbi:MAG: 4Fe-4S dicluster domain-containing protein [Chloroflexi bacterium]|nr:MAG: 4Fe-4S dicluster domain-containing protein [Chloroflexota bacterium]